MSAQHKWFAAPAVLCSYRGVKLTAHQCSTCGKYIVGKHPSQTERCKGRGKFGK